MLPGLNVRLTKHCCSTVMSANEHSDTVFECIRAGAEDYLLKPLTKKEVQYIWQHVWRRKHQPAVRTPPPLGQEQVCSYLPEFHYWLFLPNLSPFAFCICLPTG